jgi:hypothetical protein
MQYSSSGSSGAGVRSQEVRADGLRNAGRLASRICCTTVGVSAPEYDGSTGSHIFHKELIERTFYNVRECETSTRFNLVGR